MYVAGPGIEPATYGSSVFDKWRRLQSVGEINGEKIDWCLRWINGWMDGRLAILRPFQ